MMVRKLVALYTSLSLTILGVAIPTDIYAQQGRIIPGQTPCDLVSSGCAVAHSVNRRVVRAYTGNLFQLIRSSDSTTLNVGQKANGDVDLSGVGTFCGAGSTGNNAGAGANGCGFNVIKDQSGNGNDLTKVGTATPYSTDSIGRVQIHVNSAVTGYYNNASPTSVPNGNVDKTILVVMTDTTRTVCCGWYGFCHAVSDPDTPGTCYVLGIRGPCSGLCGNANANSLSVDLEEDVAEVTYAPNYSQNSLGGTFNGLGLVVGIGSYNHTSKNITAQVNNQTAQVINYSAGLGTAAQIRFGAGGDASTLEGIFYEGLIMAKETTAGDRDLLNANTMNYYRVSVRPSCGNAGRQLLPTEIAGQGVLATVAGLRVLVPGYLGPLAQIQRASDSATTDVFGVGCDIDVSAMTTFCTSTTCKISALYNQLTGATAQTSFSTSAWNTPILDFLTTLQDGSGKIGPAVTFSCLGSHPCMGFATQTMNETYGVSVAPPLTIFVASDRTGGFVGGGMVLGSSGTTPFLGYAQSTNTAYYQSAGFPNNITQTASDSSFHSVVGVTTDATHISIYVDGTAANSGSTTTSSTAISGMIFGGNGVQQFVGNVFEIVTSNSVLSSTVIQNLSSAAKAYWGY